MDLLKWIQNWYVQQCNGDWEHGSGITIETLDNPGWAIKVNLRETSLQGRTFERVNVENGDLGWWHCWLENDTFHGACGPRNLETVIAIFKEWTEKP